VVNLNYSNSLTACSPPLFHWFQKYIVILKIFIWLLHSSTHKWIPITKETQITYNLVLSISLLTIHINGAIKFEILTSYKWLLQSDDTHLYIYVMFFSFKYHFLTFSSWKAFSSPAVSGSALTLLGAWQ
jgi:hypothetical protein